jgi:glycosyltransferase involved in cell wall biosynthesis
MDTLRIALVSSYYPWPPSIGGVETIVRHVSTELALRGHEVHVLTSPFDVTSGRQVAEYGIEETDQVTVHKLKPGKLKLGYARFLQDLECEILKIKPDVVHSHCLHPHLFQTAKWKHKMNYKLLAELHHPAVELDHLSAKLVFSGVVRQLVRSSKNIDSIIAHTNLEAQWLIDKGIDSSKLHKLQFPAIPIYLFNAKSITSPKNNSLVFVGRVTWRKGLHVLIKALPLLMADVENIKLSVIGPKDDSYAICVKDLINKFKLNDHVEIKGILSEQEKIALIASNQLLVLPSLNDYTPNVVLEAQVLGVPVVASDVGAVSELVVNKETGLLVAPDDPAQLAEALKTILLDDALREKMSTQAKEHAKKFALKNTVRELEELYN